MAHLLFLSHAGADTERALRLAAAIEASPEAREHGLKVWVDKRSDGPHRLQAGTPWQAQLERAIAEQRAGSAYPFVPIIADDPGDLAHLPPFAHQYHDARLTEDGKGVAVLLLVAAPTCHRQPALPGTNDDL